MRQAREIEAKNARLAMMGTMAAGVAHEVRSPLNALALHIDYLKRLAQKQSAAEVFPKEVADNLDTAHHQIMRMEGLVRTSPSWPSPCRSRPNRCAWTQSADRCERAAGPSAPSGGGGRGRQ